jgi:hypothetical protein
MDEQVENERETGETVENPRRRPEVHPVPLKCPHDPSPFETADPAGSDFMPIMKKDPVPGTISPARGSVNGECGKRARAQTADPERGTKAGEPALIRAEMY